MTTMIIVIIILAALAVFIGLAYVVHIYNNLVRLKNNIKKSWSNINVLLKQRADELPKLISSVKGYMKHEKVVLTELTKARTAMTKAKTIPQKAAASNQVSEALKTIFAVSENYPKLRANENFIQLQARISALENEIADRREFYNDSVNNYNIRIESFPDMMVASMMSLKKQPMFQTTEEETKDVEVKF